MDLIFGHRHHHNNDPWKGSPLWARELAAMLLHIMEEQIIDRDAILAAIGTQLPPGALTDLTAKLKASDDALAASVSANQTKG